MPKISTMLDPRLRGDDCLTDPDLNCDLMAKTPSLGPNETHLNR